MPIESFSQHIAEVSNGALDDELTDFIHKSVREIKDNGGKYEISLKIKITGQEEKGEFIVAVIPTYTTKHTPIDIGGSAYQCTADNRLEAPVK